MQLRLTGLKDKKAERLVCSLEGHEKWLGHINILKRKHQKLDVIISQL